MPTRPGCCEVLAVLISHHSYGSPMDIDNIANKAAVEHDHIARDACEYLQRKHFINYYPNRGLELDNSNFGALADYLFYECDWDPFSIKTRLKHYEGWKEHNWA